MSKLIDLGRSLGFEIVDDHVVVPLEQFDSSEFGVLIGDESALPVYRKSEGRRHVIGSVPPYLSYPVSDPTYVRYKDDYPVLEQSERSEIKTEDLKIEILTAVVQDWLRPEFVRNVYEIIVSQLPDRGNVLIRQKVETLLKKLEAEDWKTGLAELIAAYTSTGFNGYIDLDSSLDIEVQMFYSTLFADPEKYRRELRIFQKRTKANPDRSVVQGAYQMFFERKNLLSAREIRRFTFSDPEKAEIKKWLDK